MTRVPGHSTVGILSDVHYASAAEQARGDDYEYRDLRNPLLRLLIRCHRHYLWLRAPLRQNHLLDRFLEQCGPLDWLVANGDYSCDSAFTGVSDDAVCQSTRECLDKLRRRFGDRLLVTYGDHELGKLSFFGGRGGMRLASWRRAREELKLPPFWQVEIGSYILMAVVSSLIALPAHECDLLAGEQAEWAQLRTAHLEEIRRAFAALRPSQRVLLFCHDPTALPFLGEEEAVRAKFPQIEQTIIGHLHSNLVLWKSRMLAGMPPVNFLGPSVRRLSAALSRARLWRPFHVRLCRALGGIVLLKDGGYYVAELDPTPRQPAQFRFCPLPR